MHRNHTRALVSALLLTIALMNSIAFASSDDTQQPINIEADQAEINERDGVMTYTGHVLLRQGGIELRADTVVVYAKEGELERITAQGEPVHYLQKQVRKQTQNADDRPAVRGVSQRMEYRAKDKRLLLLGNAEFWQGGNRFSGNRIQYDPEAERVIANAGDSGTGNGTGDVTGSKPPRVTVTLQPKTSSQKGNAAK